MFGERLLDITVDGDTVSPRYLTTRDERWVEPLLDTVIACAGLCREEVEDRLAKCPRLEAPWKARQAMIDLLLRLHGFEVVSAVSPVRAREVLFSEAARAAPETSRSEVVLRAARALAIDTERLERSLFADLPGARCLMPMKIPPPTQELIGRYNLALAQGLLLRAEALRISAGGNYKGLLRFARLKRLICEVEAGAPGEGDAAIAISGPLSLFRFTTKYGHAMAEWLPALCRTPSWTLEATCVIGGERRRWRASHHDPIGTTHVPFKRFDSKVEERFFRDLMRLAPRWEVLREADPVRVGSKLACPDFTLQDRARGLRVPVEIVGYWTPEYLRAKVETVSRLPPGVSWVLCVDESLADHEVAVPAGPVFRFRGRIDAAAFLAFVEDVTCGARSDT